MPAGVEPPKGSSCALALSSMRAFYRALPMCGASEATLRARARAKPRVAAANQTQTLTELESAAKRGAGEADGCWEDVSVRVQYQIR